MDSTPERFVVTCTHCGHRGTTTNPDIAGRKTKCRACDQVFRVPTIVTAVEPVAPPMPARRDPAARVVPAHKRSLDDLFNDPEVIEALSAPPAPAARPRRDDAHDFGVISDARPARIADLPPPAEGSRPAPRTRPCPFCAEPILPAAAKCKHCGEWLDASKAPAAARPSTAPQVVIHNNNHLNSHAGAAINVRGDGSHLVAALLSFFMPGLGQLVRGQLLGAMAWFFVTVVAYVMLLPVGFFVHLLCVVMAAQPDRR